MSRFQSYRFEITFAKEGYTSTRSIIVNVDGYDNKKNIIDPIPLNSLIEEYGEYTITLSLWNLEYTEKYDEVVLPSILYNPLILYYLFWGSIA